MIDEKEVISQIKSLNEEYTKLSRESNNEGFDPTGALGHWIESWC